MQAPWERFAAQLERREDFVVRRARLRAASGELTCGDWDLQFRCGAWLREARAACGREDCSRTADTPVALTPCCRPLKECGT